MAERDIRRMTVEEFLAWKPDDDERYELVDGLPRAMTGAQRRHDSVVVNALFALRGRLRGSECGAHTADIGVRTGPTRLRRPDVTVDCGPRGSKDLVARNPVLVIEVLSGSTHKFDKDVKVFEYRTLPSVQQILLIDPDEPVVLLHECTQGGSWDARILIGRETTLDLWSIGISFALGELYEGLD